MPTEIKERLLLKVKNLPTPDTKLMFYLFNTAGKVVAKAPVENLEAKLDLPEKTEELALHIGPVITKEGPEAEMALNLIREVTPEIIWKPGEKIELDLLRFFPLTLRMEVEGQVVKVVPIGHTKMELPVPKVLVRVLEVDPIPPRRTLLAQTVTRPDGTFRTMIVHQVFPPFPIDWRPDLMFAIYNGIELIHTTPVKWDVVGPVYHTKIYV